MKLILQEDDDVMNSKEQKKDQKKQFEVQDGKCPSCDRLLKLDYGWMRKPR